MYFQYNMDGATNIDTYENLLPAYGVMGEDDPSATAWVNEIFTLLEYPIPVIPFRRTTFKIYGKFSSEFVLNPLEIEIRMRKGIAKR